MVSRGDDELLRLDGLQGWHYPQDVSLVGFDDAEWMQVTWPAIAAVVQPARQMAIQAMDILIDVQGTADISNIKVNGVTEVPLVGPPTSKDQCKKGGWQKFNNPAFKNQGQCVSYFNHHH